ncbi:transmembrane protein 275 [Stegostoma tigrinum]|uniref:transmembrane protein 275 n=1 Tax=Stegostoma tigrinum TaxID=3053191 RepID=UPI00202B6980|nr:transmembrane protein 275 [Stegostoma tigrinum]XP_048395601.1 transmembrane protein 275 [Stegostoma tigrinum]XP_048395602.1 transmembrane protein 275 [Stegostoma tigrinum]
MFTEKTNTTVPQKPGQKKTRPQGLPSPALCCACGLCIMLAGINITLVGAFAFGTFLPVNNPPIIIGPILLVVAFAFFAACCICSRRPPAHGQRKSKPGSNIGIIKPGHATFEIETSEHTVQDTTAVQLSPTNSPVSSKKSTPVHENSKTCKLFTMDANNPGAKYTAGAEAIQLNLPRDLGSSS